MVEKLYRGLERKKNKEINTPKGEKIFWHEMKDEYTPTWTIRQIVGGNILHITSDFFDLPDLGAFKHVLETNNTDFEYHIYEKGILRRTKQ